MSRLNETRGQGASLVGTIDIGLGAEGNGTILILGNITTISRRKEDTEVVLVPDSTCLTSLAGGKAGKGRGGSGGGLGGGLGGLDRGGGGSGSGGLGRGRSGGRLGGGSGGGDLSGSSMFSGGMFLGGSMLLGRGVVLLLFLFIDSSTGHEADEDSQHQSQQEDGGAHICWRGG